MAWLSHTHTHTNSTCKDKYNFLTGFWMLEFPKEQHKYTMQLLQCNTWRSSETFLNPILPSYWFKNAPEYILFLQTTTLTFVKCFLLSPLKVKTMKYYLICNPRKCPTTTCPSLEICQNKVRGKVKTANGNLRQQHGARIRDWTYGLHSIFWSLHEDLCLFFLTHVGVLGFEI